VASRGVTNYISNIYIGIVSEMYVRAAWGLGASRSMLVEGAEMTRSGACSTCLCMQHRLWNTAGPVFEH